MLSGSLVWNNVLILSLPSAREDFSPWYRRQRSPDSDLSGTTSIPTARSNVLLVRRPPSVPVNHLRQETLHLQRALCARHRPADLVTSSCRNRHLDTVDFLPRGPHRIPPAHTISQTRESSLISQ